MSTNQDTNGDCDRAVDSGANKNHLLLFSALAVLLAIFMVLFSPLAASAQTASEAETEKIRTIIKKYEKSVSDADTKIAGEIWLQTNDVYFIHPLGQEHGWEEIKRNVYEKLMGETFSERKLSASDIAIHIYNDAAWTEFSWVFVAKLRGSGSPVRTEGRETQIYRKTEIGWRLVHVHYSGLLVKPKTEGL